MGNLFHFKIEFGLLEKLMLGLFGVLGVHVHGSERWVDE